MYLLPFYIYASNSYIIFEKVSRTDIKLKSRNIDLISYQKVHCTVLLSDGKPFVELSKLHICTTVVLFFFWKLYVSRILQENIFNRYYGRMTWFPAIIPIKHFHNHSIIWISSQRKQDFAWPHTENQIIRPWYMYQLRISIITICISS